MNRSVFLLLPLVAVLAFAGAYAGAKVAAPQAILDSWHSSAEIQVKAWLDVNGTYGTEVIPYVALSPYPSSHEGWVTAPFFLDSSNAWTLTANATYHGVSFKFWQSQKTGFITQNRTLTLNPGFESDTWWENY